jgi:hypothetical protein
MKNRYNGRPKRPKRYTQDVNKTPTFLKIFYVAVGLPMILAIVYYAWR